MCMPEQLNIDKDETVSKSFDYLRNQNKFLVENKDDLNELDTNTFFECLAKIMTGKMGI